MPQLIKRHPEWRQNLCAYFATVARQKFRPGSHDCALFAAGAVEAMTGVDLAATYAGRYRTVSEGMAILRAEGVSDLSALVLRHFEEIPPLKAGVGDLTLVEGEGGEDALGVVQGASIFVLQREGLGRVSLEVGLKGFKV